MLTCQTHLRIPGPRPGGPAVRLLLWLLLGAAPLAAARGPDPAPDRLDSALSPYPRLHTQTPVDWYPWGTQAFERARLENKPIFLSVGYSACHWCGAMEREVFSDPEIAGLMNAWFVNIKVDREERPDVDCVYMTATQLLSGRAGWPNSVFLTPDLEPFFAGTYFPPRDTVRERGFRTVLGEMRDAWRLRRAEVLKVASRVSAAVAEQETRQQAPPMAPDTVLVERALTLIRGRFDRHHGGFGGAPKFPPCLWLEFLLADADRQADPGFRRVIQGTLRGIAHGGIHDQVGGGFHRYAVDAAWRMPRFEKMLYTQSQLSQLYLRAYAATGDTLWYAVADRTLRFIRAEMTDPEGGFHSALHADSRDGEGAFYRWTPAQLAAALGPDAELFQQVFGLTRVGDGEAGVLYQQDSLTVAADLSSAALRQQLRAMLTRLRASRAQRSRPGLDEKVVTAWHAMALRAFVSGYRVLGDREHLETALRAARFVETKLWQPSGGLARYGASGRQGGAAFLQDYAQLVRAYVDLGHATGDGAWWGRAEDLACSMISRFWDGAAGGFFLSEGQQHLPVRSRNARDGAVPAANAAAVHALLDLAEVTGSGTYLHYAARALSAFGGMMRAKPLSYVHLIAAAERYLRDFSPVGAGAPQLYLARGPGEAGIPLTARVDLQPAAPVPGQAFFVNVHLSIRDGWQINANPASGAGLIPASLTLDADLPVELLGVQYPEGSITPFATRGGTLRVYSGSVTVRAALRVPKETAGGEQGDLRIRLRYQACGHGRCLAPAELTRRVPLRLAPAAAVTGAIAIPSRPR